MRQVLVVSVIALCLTGIAALVAYDMGVQAGRSAGFEHGRRLLKHEAVNKGLGRWSSVGEGEQPLFEWTPYPDVWHDDGAQGR
jgi:hypothetical protein